jgi:hypothetical protein
MAGFFKNVYDWLMRLFWSVHHHTSLNIHCHGSARAIAVGVCERLSIKPKLSWCCGESERSVMEQALTEFKGRRRWTSQ